MQYDVEQILAFGKENKNSGDKRELKWVYNDKIEIILINLPQIWHCDCREKSEEFERFLSILCSGIDFYNMRWCVEKEHYSQRIFLENNTLNLQGHTYEKLRSIIHNINESFKDSSVYGHFNFPLSLVLTEYLLGNRNLFSGGVIKVNAGNMCKEIKIFEDEIEVSFDKKLFSHNRNYYMIKDYFKSALSLLPDNLKDEYEEKWRMSNIQRTLSYKAS